MNVLSEMPGCMGYQVPKLGTPTDVVMYMIAKQQQFFGDTIYRTVPHTALIKHIKTLLNTFTYTQIGEAIDLACQTANHPFSVSFIREILTCQQELELYIISAYFQSKC